MTEDCSDTGNSMVTSRYKLVFVGDVSVGKTSIMTRYIENTFKEQYDPTIGVDFFTKSMEFREKSIKLQIWDSAGQERYKSLIPSYVRGAAIIFIVYDISRKYKYCSYFISLGKETFASVPTWITFIKNVKVDGVVLVLCGNKTDLSRQVSTEEGEGLADKEGMHFFEISAKTGQNVSSMIYSSVAELQFFSQFDPKNKTKIIEELEVQNKKETIPSSKYELVSVASKELNIQNAKDKAKGAYQERKCKC